MKLKATVSTGLVLCALLLAPAAPSFAESPGTLTPAPVGAPSPADDAEMTRLQALVGTQTQAEIQAIIAAGPSMTLFDPETGGVSAAYPTEDPSPISRMISMRGPGCGGGDACAMSGTIPHGWYGTGSLTINTTGVTKISAGSYVSTFWYSGSQGIFVAANQTVALPKSYNLVKLTRG